MLARLLLAALLFVSGAFAGPARAQMRAEGWIPAQDRRGGQDDERTQNVRSVREIISMLRARFGGELVSANLERGPRPTYFILWRMPDGSYRDFQVDAVSGQIR